MENPKRVSALLNVDHKANELRRYKKTGENRTLCHSPGSSKRGLQHKRPALMGKENIPRSKPGHQKSSIKDFFADLPRSNVDKKRKLVIFDETQASKKSKTISTQTEQVDENVELLCSEKPSEKYWELLAEERRRALKEALQENKELAVIIEEKDETIEKLKGDIEKLQGKAEQAEYFASVIEKLGEGCLDEEDAAEKDSSPDIIEESSSCEDDKQTSSEDSSDQSEEEQTVDAFDTTDSNCEGTTASDCDTDTPDSVFSSADSDKENKDPLLQEPVEYSPSTE